MKKIKFLNGIGSMFAFCRSRFSRLSSFLRRVKRKI